MSSEHGAMTVWMAQPVTQVDEFADAPWERDADQPYTDAELTAMSRNAMRVAGLNMGEAARSIGPNRAWREVEPADMETLAAMVDAYRAAKQVVASPVPLLTVQPARATPVLAPTAVPVETPTAAPVQWAAGYMDRMQQLTTDYSTMTRAKLEGLCQDLGIRYPMGASRATMAALITAAARVTLAAEMAS